MAVPSVHASTSFEETAYKLDLPHTDAETVDTSLMLLRGAPSPQARHAIRQAKVLSAPHVHPQYGALRPRQHVKGPPPPLGP